MVNDAAEHSVALMSAFNESVMPNETELQILTHVVEGHRIQVPDAGKGTLLAQNSR